MYLCMDKKYRNRLFLCIVFPMICLLVTGSCKQKPLPAEVDTSEPETELPADFIDFYKRFHLDSGFQLSHITFPLQGKLQAASGDDSLVTWTAENWKVHKSIAPDEFWAVDFTIPMEGTVMEFIHARNAGYYMERRFAKLDGTWHLIYYSGMHSAQHSEAEIDSLIESGEIEIEQE